MAWYDTRGRWTGVLLIGSLAFNAGVLATLGVQLYGHYQVRPELVRGRGPETMFDRLDLSPDQSSRMHAAKEEMFQKLGDLWPELTVENEVLADLIVADEPDRIVIAEQMTTVASIRQRMHQQLIEHFLDMREMLEPEQRAAWNDFIRHRLRMPGGSGPHGFGPPPFRDHDGLPFGGPPPRGRPGRPPTGDNG